MASKKPLDVRGRLAAIEAQLAGDAGEGAASVRRLVERARSSVARSHEELEAYIADVDRLHTDDFPILEFHAARDRFRKFRAE